MAKGCIEVGCGCGESAGGRWGVSRGRRGRGGDCIVVVSMIVSYSVPAKVVAFGGDGDGRAYRAVGRGQASPSDPSDNRGVTLSCDN